MDESYLLLYPGLEEHHFWWKVRRSLVHRLIEHRVDLSQASVLDIGCGSGVTIEYLDRAGAKAVVGVEIDETSTREGSTVEDRIVRGDFISMDLEGEHDIVMMLDVLEHLQDDVGALAKVRGLVSDRGLVVLTVPAHMWLWTKHDETNAHFRRYRAREVRDLLRGAGFEVDQLGYMFAGLILPKLMFRWLEKVGVDSKDGSIRSGQGPLMSRVAFRWFSWEAALALKRNGMLPVGTSVVAVARPSAQDPQAGPL